MKSRLTEKIEENIPPQYKAIPYLMDILDIGRESAYRRLRGEIQFSFEEVAKLAYNLGFSLDEIINGEKINRTFLDFLVRHPDPIDSFIDMFKKYTHIIDYVTETDHAVMIASVNRLPLYLMSTNDALFKFYYLNYLYQLQGDEVFTTCSFSNVNFPPEVVAIRERFAEQLINIRQFVFVVSKGLFLNVCREIQYFYNRNFLSKKEVSILQDALFELVESMKKTMQNGESIFDTRHLFYLSYMDISANSACVSFGEDVIAQFWIYGPNFIEVRNQEVCYMYKEWFEYLKRYAVMISMSNEMFRIKFFDMQCRYIENVTKEFSYFE